MPIKHLRQAEVAQRWSVSHRTLERWRWTGQGPRFLKVGGRVVYRVEDIEAYEAEQLRVGLGRQRLSSNDPLLRHKTTARRLYDDTLRAATAAGCFDAVLLNERGEVADGARSSIFVEGDDGCLLTPPLAAGALAGVLRQSLIDCGRAREGETIHVPTPGRTHTAKVVGTVFFDPENKRLSA